MTWVGRQSISTGYLFSLADFCLRSLLSGLTSVFKRLCPSQIESLLGYCMRCLEAFISESKTKQLLAVFCVSKVDTGETSGRNDERDFMRTDQIFDL